jgi:hypothetical protein
MTRARSPVHGRLRQFAYPTLSRMGGLVTEVFPDQSYPIAMPPIPDMVQPAIDVSENESANVGISPLAAQTQSADIGAGVVCATDRRGVDFRKCIRASTCAR